jgi:hypothetical protein
MKNGSTHNILLVSRVEGRGGGSKTDPFFLFFFLLDYLNMRGGKVILRALQAPEVSHL